MRKKIKPISAKNTSIFQFKVIEKNSQLFIFLIKKFMFKCFKILISRNLDSIIIIYYNFLYNLKFVQIIVYVKDFAIFIRINKYFHVFNHFTPNTNNCEFISLLYTIKKKSYLKIYLKNLRKCCFTFFCSNSLRYHITIKFQLNCSNKKNEISNITSVGYIFF